jgi:VCBS repeat-containing protein
VVGGQLKLAAGQSLDFEAASTVSVDVTATDKGGLSRTETFVIGVNDVNEVPTDIALSSAAVNENAVGAIIGTLTVTDPDAGDSHTFGVSDARFQVVGGQLKLAAGQSLDFEAASTVSVDVTATDKGGLSRTETFVISVNDVNEVPTDIALSNATVNENAVGAVIGNLTVTDPDAGDSHTFGVSDGRFQVVAGQLKLAAGQSLDFEAAVDRQRRRDRDRQGRPQPHRDLRHQRQRRERSADGHRAVEGHRQRERGRRGHRQSHRHRS